MAVDDTGRASLGDARDLEWREARARLVPVLREAQELIAKRIANHGTTRCACQWCQLSRDIDTALTYCPGGSRYA